MTTTILRKNSKNQIVREVYRNKQFIITGGVEDIKALGIYSKDGKLLENGLLIFGNHSTRIIKEILGVF